ncbi:ferredoxin [bacterium]|jgi:ferredoxin|nr:ferredoxin [bacterium]
MKTNKKIKKIIIQPGCLSCGACEFLAPDVFEVSDISHVKSGVDLDKNREKIHQAVVACPVGVIEVEEGGDGEKQV